MTDPDFLNPPIELIATSPRLQMIKSRLKAAGLRPYETRDDVANEDPMLIDAQSISGKQLHQVKRQMISHKDRTVILLAAPCAPLLEDAIIITHESELSSIPARLQVAQRKKDRLHEVRLRARTAEDLVGQPIKCFSDAPASILFLGDGSSRFLSLTASLKALGVSVVSALTALSAKDYLSQRNFSCMLLDVDEGSKHALDFLNQFADDHLLASVPVFAMVHTGTNRSPEQQATIASATEIISADHPVLEIADRVSLLAEYHKAATPLTPDIARNDRIHDRMTGLFTSDFLKHHLQSQINATQNQVTPLSFMTLQLSSPSDGNTSARRALPDLAKYVLENLRQTDCAGRIDWSTIGVSLRATPYAGGVKLAQRLINRLGGANLTALNTPLGHGGSLSWRIIEKRRYHSADDLFQAGTRGPQTRIIQAA